MANKLKPYNSRPQDAALGAQMHEWVDWATSALNQLIGQGNPPPGVGVSSLNPSTINPSSAQLASAGSRPQSIATSIIAVPAATSITFYWDGTNGSTLLNIYRDDGTIAGPFSGNQTVTGLSATTLYLFYPFYQEASSLTTAFGSSLSGTSIKGTVPGVSFVTVPGVSVGTPPIAFTAGNLQAAALQYLRDRIPLSLNFATVGVTTGGATQRGGTGGGGGSGGGGRYLNL